MDIIDKKIVAVVVTYKPDPSILAQLLNALIGQVDSIIIINNGSETNFPIRDIARENPEKVTVLHLGGNMGVAYAQNRGIEFAKEQKAQYVLLMDQDSIPEAGMVQTLLSAALKKSAGAVGPRYLDTRQNNPPPFIRIRGLKLERCACPTSDTVVPVDYLVSSGCLIPISVLDHVGGMREDYFIDYVDIEWGLRARKFGYQCYGVCAAYMSHCLGNEPIKFFDNIFPLHDPLRHYYHFRNAVLLSKEQWVPANWKIVNSCRLCLKYFFYSIFAKHHLKHWKMMTLGIWHGLRGKKGQYIEG